MHRATGNRLIMRSQQRQPTYLLRLYQLALPVLWAACGCAAGVVAQPADQQLGVMGADRYFRTTIRKNVTPLLADTMFHDTTGTFVVQGAPLSAVISQAWKLREHQVVDGPDWIRTSWLYDIEAVPPPAFVVANEQQMLKNLLADHFGLEAKLTTRDLTTLVLELTPGADFAPAADDGKPRPRFYRLTDQVKLSGDLSFEQLALFLTMQLDEPVVDATGLSGFWHLEFAEFARGDRAGAFAALANAGLKLAPGTRSSAVLAVRRIEHPDIDE